MRSFVVLNTGLAVVWLVSACSDGREAIGRRSEALGVTFVVNHTGDEDDADTTDVVCATAAGNCTLRAAIQQIAAAPTGGGVPDAIHFAIPGAGVHTIFIDSALVAHSETAFVPLIIDGYTQPGSARATESSPARILIEIAGSGGSHSGIVVRGNSTLRGLALNRFFTEAFGPSTIATISASGDNNVIEGNHIGLNAAGTAVLESENSEQRTAAGVVIRDGDGNRVGGTGPAARNVIAGAGDALVGVGSSGTIAARTSEDNVISGNYLGVFASGSGAAAELGRSSVGVSVAGADRTEISNNVISGSSMGIFFSHAVGGTVTGNLIGTDATGTVAIPNGASPVRNAAVEIEQSVDITVGGPGDRGNVISGNLVGIREQAGDGLHIEGNLIGTDITGTLPLGNIRQGIEISDDENASTSIVDNLIAYNGGDGIAVRFGLHVRMVSNTIFDNGGLAINLDTFFTFGVNPNDAGDVDEGTNMLQNFPELESSERTDSGVTVSGKLDSLPDRDYLIQIFANDTCDPSGHGEAQELVGETLLRTGTGPTAFSVDLPDLAPGMLITATATEDEEDRTSELSPCMPLNRPPVAVCEPQTVSAGAACTAEANVDGGSSDPDGDALSFEQSPAGPYPLGLTTVTLTAGDPLGATATCSATVTVVDDTPPTATCPADFATDALTPQGAPVTFSAASADNCPGALVSCAPSSGDQFAIGSTQVTCTASDGASLTSSCTFLVSVRGAAEQLAGLLDHVVALDLPAGVESSLRFKIDAALARVAVGNTLGACGQLLSLRNEILAQRGGALTIAEADALIAKIDRIRAVLGC